jgi:fatty-acyl-CoA synthase
MKITDDAGKELPWDGKTFGRLKVSRPAVAEGLFQGRWRRHPRRDGFFDTGDVATIDPRLHADHRPRQGRDQVRRRMDLLDRLENLAVGHPAVRKPAVIGVASSQMGRAAAADRAAQARARGDAARTS